MSDYLLYRSGIHDATVSFLAEGVFFQERNCMNNEWGAPMLLKDEKARELNAYYHINPDDIYKRLAEYRTAFHTSSRQVKLSWGAVYDKHETSDHLWVEREKKFPMDIVVMNSEPVAFISPSRENCCVLVQEGFEDYTPVKLWADENLSKATYGIEHHGKFLVPMRDGVNLATEVWLPKDMEKLEKRARPVIFVRTPYGRHEYDHAYVNFLQRGYAVVIQDTRGRQDSEGEWIPMSTEVEDGDDTLNWIADQSWCDGNIGMIGASYGGFVQWAAAASGNPHLKALISIVTAGGPFIDIPRKGGTFVSGMLAWAFAMVDKEFKPENMVRSDWDDVLNIRPLKDIPKKALGKEVPFWNEWMAHHAKDEFWRQSDWYQYKENINVPAMIVSGWYDDNGMGTTQALDIVSDYKSQDRKVILGPWMHNANTIRDIQGVALGNNALRYDLDVQYQRWFDHQLKYIDNGIDEESRVEYYVTGTNQWETSCQWPPKAVDWTTMYLGSQGKAATSSGDGHLTFAAADEGVEALYDEFVYDPEDPAPHLIDMSENEIGVPADYKAVNERDDVLVYDSEPLKNPLTLVGDIQVTFHASSSARDTDWVVRLEDVDPDGHSIKLVDGVLRARFRNGFEQEELLKPGEVEKYIIRTSKLANTFKIGHRIRLVVTSSADNYIFPNTNTGEDPATDVNSVKAVQRLYHGGATPSYVQLPVL
uniref:CocE/NonD family hydrolase n=1 Tax=uncultured Allobacillus sp. TaxID=1638025 RepID=UPI002591A412|nr:CocE/NonD family hydrolase [uncultured Allobacillus sp.]